MFSNTAIAASVASFLVAQVSATGSAILKNECSSNVYVWTVSNTPGEMTTIAPGDSYTEGYQTNPDGGGISMKIATQPDQAGSITQFEYTLTNEFWYDISNINGFPFMASGLTLTPSHSNCRSMVCEAGVELCSAAYNQPDDNSATAMCDTDSDMTLVLCSGQKTNVPVSLASSVGGALEKAVNNHGNAAPASPATSAAPAAPAVNAAPAAPAVSAAPAAAPVAANPAPANNGGVFTTFVTQLVTITAREAAPEATGLAKRVHNHHFQRHADSN